MKDPEFDQFVEGLEALKHQPPSFKTRQGLTNRVMAAVQNDKKQLARSRIREVSAPFAVAAALGLLWFFFRIPAPSGRITDPSPLTTPHP